MGAAEPIHRRTSQRPRRGRRPSPPQSLADFEAAGLAGVRSHEMRRTFASIAADQGYSDATIGELLGHSRRGVTARHYTRRPDAALVAAADSVSALIVAALDKNSLCGGPSR